MRPGFAYLVGGVASLLVVLVAAVAGDTTASAQGSKDRATGTQSSPTTRSGVSTNSSQDSMGGAFKGAGAHLWNQSGNGIAQEARALAP